MESPSGLMCETIKALPPRRKRSSMLVIRLLRVAIIRLILVNLVKQMLDAQTLVD